MFKQNQFVCVLRQQNGKKICQQFLIHSSRLPAALPHHRSNFVGRRRPVCAAQNLTTIHVLVFLLLLRLFCLSSLAGSLVVLTSQMDKIAYVCFEIVKSGCGWTIEMCYRWRAFAYRWYISMATPPEPWTTKTATEVARILYWFDSNNVKNAKYFKYFTRNRRSLWE